MTNIERIDAEIDRFWFAKWKTEANEAARHEQRHVDWRTVSLSEVQIGEFVYDILKNAVGVGAGKDGTDWIVTTPKGNVRCSRDIPVFVRGSASTKSCECELCVGVRDRNAFIASMGTKPAVESAPRRRDELKQKLERRRVLKASLERRAL